MEEAPAYNPDYASTKIEEPSPQYASNNKNIQSNLEYQHVQQQQNVSIPQQPAPSQIPLSTQPGPNVVYVDQNGHPIPSGVHVVVVDQNGNPIPQQQQQQLGYNNNLQVNNNNDNGGSIEGNRTMTNLDELPPDYQSIIDGSYDQKLNVPKEGVGLQQGCSGHIRTWTFSISTILISITFIILIFTVGLYTVVGMVGGIAMCCLLYTCEWNCASTPKYLSNILGKGEVYEEMSRLNKCIPTIKWHVECYHYKTYTDSKGRRKRRKVTTHRADMFYAFDTVQDISVEFKGLEEWQLTKLTLFKTFSFNNTQTENDYNFKSAEFRRNNDRDRHQSFSVVMNLDGFINKVLVEAAPGNRSKYLSRSWYSIASLLFCSPCYRTWFSAKSGKKHYIIQKQIGKL